MIPLKHQWKRVGLLIGAAALVTDCVALSSEEPSGNEVIRAASANRISEAPPEHETVRYYIGKLPDRDYVETYGDEENPRPWYTAAEALGEMGKPAIPALIERLGTPDPYELKLALYALMLASQDTTLKAETRGDYLRLGTVLTEDTNEENRRLALDWWQRYQHLWQ